MSYSERAYFDGDYAQHCADREEHQRLQRKRQAIIEHYRTMKAQRRFARDNAARIAAAWDELPTPPLTIAQHVEHARKMRANGCATGLSSFGSSPQAVSPVPASIPFAGER